MSSYIHKSHNVTVLPYHLVFPAKYRRAMIDATVDQVLREVCLEIEARYQLKFPEIGTDEMSLPCWCGRVGKVHHAALAICSQAWAGVKKPSAEWRRRRL